MNQAKHDKWTWGQAEKYIETLHYKIKKLEIENQRLRQTINEMILKEIEIIRNIKEIK